MEIQKNQTMQCIGYGEYENQCCNQAGGKMKPKSKLWCDRCKKLRRSTITKQLEGILASFPSDETGKVAGSSPA